MKNAKHLFYLASLLALGTGAELMATPPDLHCIFFQNGNSSSWVDIQAEKKTDWHTVSGNDFQYAYVEDGHLYVQLPAGQDGKGGGLVSVVGTHAALYTSPGFRCEANAKDEQ